MLATAGDIPCNLCGSLDSKTLFEAGKAQAARIVSCSHCGLMFSSPRARAPDQDIVKTYDPEVTSRVEETGHDRFEKERLQTRDYDDSVAYLARLYPQRGKLLEIGCGMGFLLAKFAQDGWDVLGLEPDKGYCQFIADHHKLKAQPTILEESGIAPGSFDAAVMLHVIEHVPDPLSTLRSIFDVLKPGGHLVLETPRYDTLMFKLLRHRERSLSCDGHIYFFTSDTLKQLTEKAGFRMVKRDYVGRSLSASRLLWNLGVMSKSKALQSAFYKLSERLNLDEVRFKLNARDMQRVLLQKPA